MPALSIAIPIFDEAEAIPELLVRLTKTVEESRIPIREFLFVDDGSTDDSVALLRAAQQRDPRIRIIVLSRNFGHQNAISAAIDQARGDALVIMDADLQDPPLVLPALYERWRGGFEIVYAVRNSRKEGAFKRLSAAAFYRVLNALSEVRMPLDAGDFCLLDAKVVAALRAMPERSRYVRGLRAWVGFRTTAVPFDRDERFAGETKYSLRKMLSLATTSILGFSIVPLRIGIYIGIITALVSAVAGIVLLALRLAYGSAFAVTGWTSLALAIFFVGGVQLLLIGVMGEYVGRIYREVQQRPLYLVREIHESAERPA